MPTNVNKWIGPNIVPRPVGAWVSTAQYQPLFIVGYNGNSYIAMSYVPAGVNPSDDVLAGGNGTNGKYWMLTSNFSEQLDDVNSNVLTLSNTLNASFGKSYFTAYHKIIARQAVKINCVGDSITASYAVTHGYVDLLAGELSRITGSQNVSVTNLGVGGYTSDDVLTALLAGTYTANSPDLLTIMVGTNDAAHSDPTTFFNNMLAICDYLVANNIQCLFIDIPPAPRSGGLDYTVELFNTVLHYVCNMRNFVCLNLHANFNNALANSSINEIDLYVDSNHPSDFGHLIILNTILEIFKSVFIFENQEMSPMDEYSLVLDTIIPRNDLTHTYTLNDPSQNLKFHFMLLNNDKKYDLYADILCTPTGVNGATVMYDNTAVSINTNSATQTTKKILIASNVTPTRNHTITFTTAGASSGSTLDVVKMYFDLDRENINQIFTDAIGNTLTASTYTVLQPVDDYYKFHFSGTITPAANSAGMLTLTLPGWTFKSAGTLSGNLDGKYALSTYCRNNTGNIEIYKYDGTEVWDGTSLVVTLSGIVDVDTE